MIASRRTLLLAAALLVGSGAARAGGPKAVEVSGEEGLAKGTLESLSLASDGVLRPGPAFDATALDAPTAWAAAVSGETLWVGCGNDASLRRVGKDGKVEKVALGEGLMVTALAPLPQGGVAAAVFPGGRILKVSAEGKSEPLATIPAEHVWALLADARGGLSVASGLPAAVWSVDPFGALAKVCTLDAQHARSLSGTADDLLVGTAGKGRVYAVKGGKPAVVRDLSQDEVVGLVRLADGSLIVAANSDAGAGNAQQLATLLKQMLQPPPTRGEGKEPQPRAALQDGTLLHLEASGAVTTLWEAKKTALLALVKDGEGAAAGTYPSGRVVRVAPGSSALLADLPEAEASVLVADANGLSAVVTSNPAVLHRRRSGEAKGTYTSAPLDAGAVARWGRMTATGRGLKGASWRAGETAEPDASWSPWTPCGGFDGTAGTTGVTARFLEVQVALEGADAELRALSVVAEAPNRAPVLSALTLAKPKPKEGTAGPTAQREITWKAEDADGDDLLTTVEVQRDGSSRWSALVKSEALAKPTTTWDTTGLPDGLYRVRVSVSDSPANPAERARTAVLVSGPERIDNTAPRVTATARLVGDRLVVEGEAQDQPGGRVVLVRLSLDGGPWQPLSARDGLYDSATEGFSASLPSPGPGDHDLVLQAVDADDNPGAVALSVTVPDGAR